MATLTTTPEYPVPGKPVQVVFAYTESGANFLRVWITDAPEGSKYRKRLTDEALSRVELFTSEGGTTWTNGDFDKGGIYRLVVQEYTRGAATFGGGYENSPGSAPTETKAGSESTLSVHIGQRMTQEIGAGQDKAQLVLFVWNDSIRATSVAVHGETTPAIVNPSTPRSTMAMSDTSVRAAVAALAGQTALAAIGTLGTVISNIRTKFEVHRTQATVHQNNDADNAINNSFAATPTPATYALILNELIRKFTQHVENDAGGVSNLAGKNSRNYHDVSGTKIDWSNRPLFQSVGSVADAYAATADLWRCYEAHRVSTGVHDNADNTNALSGLGDTILNVHRLFLVSLAASNPTAPNNKSTAAVLLMAGAGFKES